MLGRAVLLLSLVSTPAFAGASFDCQKAVTAQEKKICADPVLSDLDGEIATAYKGAMQRLAHNKAAQAALMKDQRSFVAERNTYFGLSNFDMKPFMAGQRDFLASIDGAPRNGLVGLWADSSTSRATITREGRGFKVWAKTVDGPREVWRCEWDERVKPQGEALIGLDGEEPVARFARKGALLEMKDLPELAPGKTRDSLPAHCGPFGKLDALLFPVAEKSLARTAPTPVAAPAKDIAELFRLLPLNAFDMTTDGLDDKEKADLVAKQESPSWKIRRISADKMVVTPKVGAGTVTLSLRPFEGGVLEVHTQNMRVSSYKYFKLTADGKAVQPHAPALVAQVLNEATNGSDGTDAELPFRRIDAAKVPQELKDYIVTRGDCAHWAGEAGEGNKARSAEIARNVKLLGCDGLDAKDKTFRAKYKGNDDALAVLNRVKELETER